MSGSACSRNHAERQQAIRTSSSKRPGAAVCRTHRETSVFPLDKTYHGCPVENGREKLVDVEVVEQQIPADELERMMKAQEVILKAAAGKLKWWEAAEIMGVTDRTMQRWRDRLNEHGYAVHGTTGNGSRARSGCRW